MPGKNKLSVYLIKDEFSDNDANILKRTDYSRTILDGVGTVYFSASRVTVPSWIDSFFCGTLQSQQIFSSNARAILICRVLVDERQSKTFALSLGYGKNMLADSVVEEDFGIRVVLNTINPSSLRRIKKTSVGGNQKSSSEQLPLESDIDDFGFDVERDLISTITGKSNRDDELTGIVTGGDMLSLTTEVDIANLHDFLRLVYRQYISQDYKREFGWIDQIRKVKDGHLIDNLNLELYKLIIAKSPRVWMAVPEVIEWESILGFKYAGDELLDDIIIDVLISNLRNGFVSIEQLKNKRIYAIRSDNEQTYTSWNAFNCLYGEVEFEGKEYCINNGQWYCINQDFSELVNAEYDNFPVYQDYIFPWQEKYQKEAEYSMAFAESSPEHYLFMDSRVITHGGGQSKVELCDVLSNDGTYFHVKPYSGSSTLSHLFNQAVVSAELVLSDSLFREKANDKIREYTTNEQFLIPVGRKPKVVFVVLSRSNSDRPLIPFFSKIAIRYAKKRLNAFGCEVYIRNVMKQ